MQICANGIAIEVEDHGPTHGEPLLLIMGLGMQLVGWHDEFVAILVRRGFRVIRFDNRDAGLSQQFDHLGVPNLVLDSLRHAVGWNVSSPYRLADMAADSVAVLDALGIASAHVCGTSMGGMIAQHVAARHPRRTRSLSLMMTTSGARHLPQPSLRVRGALMAQPRDPGSIDGLVDHHVGTHKVFGSPAYPPEEAWLRDRLTMTMRRAYRPRGTARQLVAIAADGDRSPMLGGIHAPTLVLHGRHDPLVPVAAGFDLAARIAGAEIDVIDGMGHDLPAALWPRFADGIARAAARA